MPDFGEAVGLAAKFRMFFDWTRFIQNPSVGFSRFEYTANELTSTNRRKLPNRRLASRRFRVATTEFKNASGKDFSPVPGGQVKNDGHILDRCFAIRARQKISVQHFDLRAGGRRSIIDSIPASSLEGLTRQTRFRNPRSSRLCRTRDPMKPAAPVTRIRSSGPTMNPSGRGKPLSGLAILAAKLFISRRRGNVSFNIFPTTMST